MAERKTEVDTSGVPRCTYGECPQFDGKRCRELGFRPESICEPAIIDLVEAAHAAATEPTEATRVERSIKDHCEHHESPELSCDECYEAKAYSDGFTVGYDLGRRDERAATKGTK